MVILLWLACREDGKHPPEGHTLQGALAGVHPSAPQHLFQVGNTRRSSSVSIYLFSRMLCAYSSQDGCSKSIQPRQLLCSLFPTLLLICLGLSEFPYGWEWSSHPVVHPSLGSSVAHKLCMWDGGTSLVFAAALQNLDENTFQGSHVMFGSKAPGQGSCSHRLFPLECRCHKLCFL